MDLEATLRQVVALIAESMQSETASVFLLDGGKIARAALGETP